MKANASAQIPYRCSPSVRMMYGERKKPVKKLAATPIQLHTTFRKNLRAQGPSRSSTAFSIGEGLAGSMGSSVNAESSNSMRGPLHTASGGELLYYHASVKSRDFF